MYIRRAFRAKDVFADTFAILSLGFLRVIWIVDTPWTVDIPPQIPSGILILLALFGLRFPRLAVSPPIADIPQSLETTCTIKGVCTGDITLTADTP